MEGSADDHIFVPGILTVFRYLNRNEPYPPDSPWPGIGRFGDGSHPVIYFAESAAGATAEFLRLHPEFIGMSADLRINVFEVSLRVFGRCVDVRTVAGAVAHGIAFDRLSSSERSETVRWAECQAFANDIVARGLLGIRYQSAAAQWTTWNLVLTAGRSGTSWTSDGYVLVATPTLDTSQVVLLT